MNDQLVMLGKTQPALVALKGRLNAIFGDRESDGGKAVAVLSIAIRILTRLRDLLDFLQDLPLQNEHVRQFIEKEVDEAGRLGELFGGAAFATSHYLNDEALDELDTRASDLWAWSALFASRLGGVKPERNGESKVVIAMAQAQISDLIAAAVDGRRGLKALRQEKSSDDEGEKGSTVRQRRLRARRRYGAVYQVQLDLYAGDLSLLRQFGFLGAGGSKAEATAALEAFLLAAFLSRLDPSVSWEERIKRQRRGRIGAMVGSVQAEDV